MFEKLRKIDSVLEHPDSTFADVQSEILKAAEELDALESKSKSELNQQARLMGYFSLTPNNVNRLEQFCASGKRQIEQFGDYPGVIQESPSRESNLLNFAKNYFRVSAGLLLNARVELLDHLVYTSVDESGKRKMPQDLYIQTVQNLSRRFEMEVYKAARRAWHKVALWIDEERFMFECGVDGIYRKELQTLQLAMDEAMSTVPAMIGKKVCHREASEALLRVRHDTAIRILEQPVLFRPFLNFLEGAVYPLDFKTRDIVVDQQEDPSLFEDTTQCSTVIQVFSDQFKRCNSKCTERFINWRKRFLVSNYNTEERPKFLSSRAEIVSCVLDGLQKLAYFPQKEVHSHSLFVQGIDITIG